MTLLSVSAATATFPSAALQTGKFIQCYEFESNRGSILVWKMIDIYLILPYHIFYEYLIKRIRTNLQTKIYKGEVPTDLCVFYS